MWSLWLMLLSVFEVSMHWYTHVRSFMHIHYVCVCVWVPVSLCFPYVYVCVQCIDVESIQSKSFLVYLKEVQMVFKEQEATSRSGSGMWDWLSHIDSALFECVCVPFTCTCLAVSPQLIQSAIHLSTRLWTLCPFSFYCLYRPDTVNAHSHILLFTSWTLCVFVCNMYFDFSSQSFLHAGCFLRLCLLALYLFISTCTNFCTEPQHTFKGAFTSETWAWVQVHLNVKYSSFD